MVWSTLEDGKLLAGLDVADIGRTTHAHLTGAQYAEKLGAALGEPVRFRSVPYDDLKRLREINPALRSFDDWLAENASKIKMG